MITRTLKNGFTLVECVLTILIISIGLFGMMVLFDNVTRGAMEGDMNVVATYLAREKIEQILYNKTYNGYAWVGMNQYLASEPIVLGGSNYVRDLSIYEVQKSDLLTAQGGSGLKRVDVTVSWGTDPSQRITESTLIADY
jgi:prepilin-type N-terminal cleavage/methylation domain-containing protein